MIHRIRGKVGEVMRAHQGLAAGSWIFELWICFEGETEEKLIGMFGDFPSEAVALAAMRQMAQIEACKWEGASAILLHESIKVIREEDTVIH